jgi:putative oxidoreductase
VAIWSVHREKGFFVTGGGYEYNLVIIAAAIGITLTGPGSISVDGALGLQLSGVKWALSTVALGVIGALPALLARRASARRKTSAVNESSAPSANAGESRAG